MTKARYPWDDWLDGRVHTLIRDEHFRCTVRTMQDQIRRQAANRFKRVSVTRATTPDQYRRACLSVHAYDYRPKGPR